MLSTYPRPVSLAYHAYKTFQIWLTYDNGYTGFVRDRNNLLEVWDIVLWVSNALNIYGLCLLVDELLEVVRVVAVNELGVYAKSREEDLELVISATIASLR